MTHPAPPQPAPDLHGGTLLAEAARAGTTEFCSACQTAGDGKPCKPSAVHYGRILAAYLAGKISDAHLAAVHEMAGTRAPIPERLLRFESWQV